MSYEQTVKLLKKASVSIDITTIPQGPYMLPRYETSVDGVPMINIAAAVEDMALMNIKLHAALTATLDWLLECEAELDKPLPLGYKGNMQKPVVINKIKEALGK